MKKIVLSTLLMIVSLIFNGCSNRELSGQYFKVKPYHHITGNYKYNKEYEYKDKTFNLYLYKSEVVDRFILNEVNHSNPTISSDYFGSWIIKDDSLELTSDKGEEITIEDYNSAPKVSYSDIWDFYFTDLAISEALDIYSGSHLVEDTNIDFNLRFIETEKDFSIVPKEYKKDVFVLTVIKSKGEKVIETNEYIGEWLLKERVISLFFKDEVLYFFTKGKTIESIGYTNSYGIDKIILKRY